MVGHFIVFDDEAAQPAYYHGRLGFWGTRKLKHHPDRNLEDARFIGAGRFCFMELDPNDLLMLVDFTAKADELQQLIIGWSKKHNLRREDVLFYLMYMNGTLRAGLREVQGNAYAADKLKVRCIRKMRKYLPWTKTSTVN